jgi:hypothetical protein
VPSGRFKVTPKSMASVCHTDAAHTDTNDKEYPDRLVGSRLVLETFGGYEAIAKLLDTNLTVGIPNTK